MFVWSNAGGEIREPHEGAVSQRNLFHYDNYPPLAPSLRNRFVASRRAGKNPVKTFSEILFVVRWTAIRSRPRTVRWGVLVAMLWLSVGSIEAAAPKVTRVEPPSWWVGHSVNPVRVLLTGENLAKGELLVPEGLQATNFSTSADGRYFFADLHIPQGTSPGQIKLGIKTADGVTTAGFEVLPVQEQAGRQRGFSPDDVIYLIMTDRFANGDLANDNPIVSPGLHDRRKPRFYHGGDFRGVIERLDYLRELGVTALWLTPWYDNVNALNHREKYTSENRLSAQGRPITDYHGYGAVDFYAVDEHFGDMALLCELVRAAQARGIKVIQDQVANHTGPYHPWVQQPPTPTWFNGNATNHLENKWQTWTTTTPHPPADQLKATLEGWFINILPDLNQNDPETATYLIQNSLWWIGMTGLDAVRQDTLPYVPRSYWAQWTRALKQQHPQLTILGEMWDNDAKLVAFFQGGRRQFDGVDSGVDTLFDFPLHNAMRDVFARGAPMTRLAETLAADRLYVDATVLVPFLGLHDTPRFLHESGATAESMKLAFTFLLTTRGTPLIYYGDEIAMRGGGDPDNRRDFPGGWPEDPQNAFHPAGRTAEQAEMHAHVQQLLRLRRDLAPLRRGNVIPLLGTQNTYACARVTTDGSVVLVALNKSARPETLEISVADLPLRNTSALVDRLGALGRLALVEARLRFELPANSAAVLTPALETASNGGAAGAHETTD